MEIIIILAILEHCVLYYYIHQLNTKIYPMG